MTAKNETPAHMAMDPSKIKSIVVIGAGPYGVGLTTALLKENHFDKIQVFERRSHFGGLWNYTKPLLKRHNVTCAPCVPCESPFFESRPLRDHQGKPVFQTPSYKYLDTNVPRALMEYQGLKFPEGTPLFPTREQVLEHIIEFAKPIEKYVRFNTEVVSVVHDDTTRKYTITTKNVLDDEVFVTDADAVAIAPGYYTTPFIPHRPGLAEWHNMFPSSVSHSVDFDEPEDFRSVTGEILIIGNNASGVDIAYALAVALDRPIYKSKRSESLLPGGFSTNIKDVSDVKTFDPLTKTIYFVGGEKLENVEKVIFCTGYQKSLPFLPRSAPRSEHGNSILSNLIVEGGKVSGLYSQMLPIKLPTVALVGLPRYVLPIRLSETQGSWLARVWSGRISLPSEKLQWEYDDWTRKNNGDDIKYHDLLFPHDIQYSERLNREVRQAGPSGHFGVAWNPEYILMRGAMKEIKEAYIEYLAKTGRRALSIDELCKNGYFKWPDGLSADIEASYFAP